MAKKRQVVTLRPDPLRFYAGQAWKSLPLEAQLLLLAKAAGLLDKDGNVKA
jgi:hypothetical protein